MTAPSADVPSPHRELEDLGLALEERRDRRDVAAAREAQDGVRDRRAGRDRDVDAGFVHERQEREAVDDGDRLRRARRLREQAGEDVRVVLTGQRDDDVLTSDVFLGEQVGVGDLALEDRRSARDARRARARAPACARRS